ncbi:MAG: sulfatase, partial [Planctomycetaceae bacterium]
PCRSSLLSGQYFWRANRGAILQGAIWDSKIPSYPLLLRDAGSHIGFTYKVWSPGSPADAPYGAADHRYNKRRGNFNGFSQYLDRKRNDGQMETHKKLLLDVACGNFKDFLQDRKSDEPFCYWFGPTNVHRKWIKGSGKDFWGLNPDDLKGKLPPFLPDVHEVRQDFADYLGEVMAFDAGLGEILKELEATGELENTIIVVSGDHGAPGFPRGKCNLYDFGIAVPLAIRWGSKVKGGRVLNDFVNLPDLAPTFLEAAGIKPPSVMTAKSLLPILLSDKEGQVDPSRTRVIVGRERHVAEARTNNLPYPQRAIRTDKFLYIHNFEPDRWPMGTGPGHGKPLAKMPSFKQLQENTFAAYGDLDASPTKAWILSRRDDPAMKAYVDFAVGRRPQEELYDLGKDPHQMKNVAADNAYAQTKQNLRDELMAVLRSTGDPRVTENPVRFEQSPFTNPRAPRKPRRNAAGKKK